ncbi:MAG: pantoate--beta-alanine ligase [Bacteroidetes bacterium]|nr:pantoate--beta-alanine ligase [Bacteroidota bacterium]
MHASTGFVPTMGALHQGHLDLVTRARAENTHVLVSIFVNPAQFNNPEDLKKYPRTLLADLEKLRDAGAYAVYLPLPADLYPSTLAQVSLNLHPLDSAFESRFRPGHFEGVVKVLHRFFSVVQPAHAYFGLKDLQQCLVVEKLVDAFFPQINLHLCPTTREPDGLAMSSRNMRLGPEARSHAPEIYRQLQWLCRNLPLFGTNREITVQALATHGIETEYLDWVNLPDLNPAETPGGRQAILFAGYLQGVRLIDNVLINP